MDVTLMLMCLVARFLCRFLLYKYKEEMKWKQTS